MKFADKVAVVTGAGGNLGRAVVDAFVAAGARVAAVERGASGAAAPPDAFDRRFAVQADLLDEASTRAMADAVFDRWGRIDVLCNIAGGFAAGTPVHETSDDLWRRMFDLNVMTAVHASKAVVPRMLAAGRGQHRQRRRGVVRAWPGQHGGLRGRQERGRPADRKHGGRAAAERGRRDLHPADGHRHAAISVSCLLPTIIDTPQNRAAMPEADRGRWRAPGEVALELLQLLGG